MLVLTHGLEPIPFLKPEGKDRLIKWAQALQGGSGQWGCRTQRGFFQFRLLGAKWVGSVVEKPPHSIITCYLKAEVWGAFSSTVLSDQVMYNFNLSIGLGQQVSLGFSVTFYGETWTNFLVSPILNLCYFHSEISLGLPGGTMHCGIRFLWWFSGIVGGMCNFLGLSHHNKNLKLRTDQCYSSVLFRKQRKIHPWGVKAGWPKKTLREEKAPGSILAPLFICFSSSHWAYPM